MPHLKHLTGKHQNQRQSVRRVFYFISASSYVPLRNYRYSMKMLTATF